MVQALCAVARRSAETGGCAKFAAGVQANACVETWLARTVCQSARRWWWIGICPSCPYHDRESSMSISNEGDKCKENVCRLDDRMWFAMVWSPTASALLAPRALLFVPFCHVPRAPHRARMCHRLRLRLLMPRQRFRRHRRLRRCCGFLPARVSGDEGGSRVSRLHSGICRMWWGLVAKRTVACQEAYHHGEEFLGGQPTLWGWRPWAA